MRTDLYAQWCYFRTRFNLIEIVSLLLHEAAPLRTWAKGLLPGNHLGLPPAYRPRTDGCGCHFHAPEQGGVLH